MLATIVIILHFVFDWILQPRHIAKKKGSSDEGTEAVLIHMLLNILPFSLILGAVLYLMFDCVIEDVLGLLLLNGYSHFIIDIWLPKGNNERQMINWTAIDQILHLSILMGLLTWILK